ncbi:RidA family protein [bacterium]|nr:RidA family protein [bacterium]MBU1652898.1 RidA family protein [bacterium]
MSKSEWLSPPGDFTALMGEYSHGIRIPLPGADLIFLTGQKAMDAAGNVVAPGDPEKQTEYVFNSICKILAEADATIDDVVKAQIYVLGMKDFHSISKIRNKYFKAAKPVSTMVEVTGLSKPGCLVEIAVTAVKYHDQ